MEYNKSQFKKVQDHRVLHKIKKHWVVISAALLLALGGKAMTAIHAHADSNHSNEYNQMNTNVSQNSSSAHLTMSQSAETNASKSNVASENPSISSVSSQQITNQAHNLHQNIMNRQLTVSDSNLQSTNRPLMKFAAPELNHVNTSNQNQANAYPFTVVYLYENPDVNKEQTVGQWPEVLPAGQNRADFNPADYHYNVENPNDKVNFFKVGPQGYNVLVPKNPQRGIFNHTYNIYVTPNDISGVGTMLAQYRDVSDNDKIVGIHNPDEDSDGAAFSYDSDLKPLLKGCPAGYHIVNDGTSFAGGIDPNSVPKFYNGFHIFNIAVQKDVDKPLNHDESQANGIMNRINDDIYGVNVIINGANGDVKSANAASVAVSSLNHRIAKYKPNASAKSAMNSDNTQASHDASQAAQDQTQINSDSSLVNSLSADINSEAAIVNSNSLSTESDETSANAAITSMFKYEAQAGSASNAATNSTLDASSAASQASQAESNANSVYQDILNQQSQDNNSSNKNTEPNNDNFSQYTNDAAVKYAQTSGSASVASVDTKVNDIYAKVTSQANQTTQDIDKIGSHYNDSSATDQLNSLVSEASATNAQVQSANQAAHSEMNIINSADSNATKEASIAKQAALQHKQSAASSADQMVNHDFNTVASDVQMITSANSNNSASADAAIDDEQMARQILLGLKASNSASSNEARQNSSLAKSTINSSNVFPSSASNAASTAEKSDTNASLSSAMKSLISSEDSVNQSLSNSIQNSGSGANRSASTSVSAAESNTENIINVVFNRFNSLAKSALNSANGLISSNMKLSLANAKKQYANNASALSSADNQIISSAASAYASAKNSYAVASATNQNTVVSAKSSAVASGNIASRSASQSIAHQASNANSSFENQTNSAISSLVNKYKDHSSNSASESSVSVKPKKSASSSTIPVLPKSTVHSGASTSSINPIPSQSQASANSNSITSGSMSSSVITPQPINSIVSNGTNDSQSSAMNSSDPISFADPTPKASDPVTNTSNTTNTNSGTGVTSTDPKSVSHRKSLPLRSHTYKSNGKMSDPETHDDQNGSYNHVMNRHSDPASEDPSNDKDAGINELGLTHRASDPLSNHAQYKGINEEAQLGAKSMTDPGDPEDVDSDDSNSNNDVSQQNGKLPQTGERSNQAALTALGALATMIGGFSAIGAHRKRRHD